MPRLKSKHYEPPTPPEERGQAALIRFIDSRMGRRYGLTQIELAGKLGISCGALSNKMNGKSWFSHKEIVQIIHILDPSDEEILSFFGRTPQETPQQKPMKKAKGGAA